MAASVPVNLRMRVKYFFFVIPRLADRRMPVDRGEVPFRVCPEINPHLVIPAKAGIQKYFL